MDGPEDNITSSWNRPGCLAGAVLLRLEERSMAIACRGLREGINDMLSATAHLTPEEIKKLDNDLISAELPTVTSMRAKYWKKIKSLIKRGVIRTDEEYYILKSICEDTDLGSSEERGRLLAMISHYEGA